MALRGCNCPGSGKNQCHFCSWLERTLSAVVEMKATNPRGDNDPLHTPAIWSAHVVLLFSPRKQECVGVCACWGWEGMCVHPCVCLFVCCAGTGVWCCYHTWFPSDHVWGGLSEQTHYKGCHWDCPTFTTTHLNMEFKTGFQNILQISILHHIPGRYCKWECVLNSLLG
jgi:hypothetical protein